MAGVSGGVSHGDLLAAAQLVRAAGLGAERLVLRRVVPQPGTLAHVGVAVVARVEAPQRLAAQVLSALAEAAGDAGFAPLAAVVLAAGGAAREGPCQKRAQGKRDGR